MKKAGYRVNAFLDARCLSFKKLTLTFSITLNITILGLVFKGHLPSRGESLQLCTSLCLLPGFFSDLSHNALPMFIC